MIRCFRQDGTEVKKGDAVESFRGDTHVFLEVTRARSPGKSGKVLTNKGEFYDMVFDIRCEEHP